MKDRQFLQGYTLFECPIQIFQYHGSIPALVWLNFLARASCISMHTDYEFPLSFPAQVETLVRKLKCDERTIRRAFDRLETDGFIHRKFRRGSDGKRETGQITLYRPDGGCIRRPLFTVSRAFKVLSGNGVQSAFSVPLQALDAIYALWSAPAVSAYLAGWKLGNSFGSERFKVPRNYWRVVSELQRKGFNDGLDVCSHCDRAAKRNKLLTYRGETLTLLDPLTGKPSIRAPISRGPMPIDLDKITDPAKWDFICSHLFNTKFGGQPHNDWFRTDRECPSCGEAGQFFLNFQTASFKCHSCLRGGRLGGLVRCVLDVDMRDACQYIADVLKGWKALEVEVTV